MKVSQALLSVSDKTGLVDFARGLAGLGIRLLSTGGTAKALAAAGLPVTEVGDYTGFPEMLDGRVKTLHPKVHAGILARRDVPAHAAALAAHDIPGIELVVVNLYPFRETVANPDCTLDEAIENIDIGGPTMVRAAAKNCAHVGVVVDPADYPGLLAELRAGGGELTPASRFRLAQKAFSHTASYDAAISNYLTARDASGAAQEYPGQFNITMLKMQNLRYGENPHQSAAFYREENPAPGTLATYHQHQGKELSYNNIADADAAWECVKSFAGSAQPCACVIVKHANPCGVALGDSPLAAYQKALATDPTSAFGGIIAFNRVCDAAAAEAVSRQFVEVLIAPAYTDEALALLAKKANVRVLEVPLPSGRGGNAWDAKRVGGGLLVQSPDAHSLAAADLKVVTTLAPDAGQLADMLFTWRVAKFVKSNAIVFARDTRTLGVGAGQMSRVDSARIALIKAENAGLSLKGSVAASDAFFPFRDGLDVVIDAGATAVIQPGGSMRDDEVIAAANERGIAMVFTGVRHFRH
ncbi:MAG: bifunctional phosphoribosylaminoimidazolecarboxamide formyltransferase/IMP cyclohydrolase [Betaproteobacteria bacterium]|nr:bifunctional phosphoribosylaminoimidazolecarboxamide formyltransferase/IMP cyclohydrolase [Betaproteobacteria bacterium]